MSPSSSLHNCAAGLAAVGFDVAGEILMDFVNGGKCVYVNSYESSTIWRVEADSGYVSVHTVVGLPPPAGILTTSVPSKLSTYA